MGNLRRRIIEKSEEEDPILIKLTNPGSYTQYSFLSGYKYVDMLICGGGGSGGYNSGGGGGHGKNGGKGNGGQGIICFYYHN